MQATPHNMKLLADRAKAPIAAPGIMAYSPTTGEQYSATPGDYWDMPQDRPLIDANGEPMILVSRRVQFVEV